MGTAALRGSLTGLAEPLRRMALWLDRLGSDRGGMLVEAVGWKRPGGGARRLAIGRRGSGRPSRPFRPSPP
jgi:hypothetical protein